MNYKDQIQVLSKETSEEKLAELYKDAGVFPFPYDLVKLVDGIEEVLESLSPNYKLALVTNASMGYVGKVLDMHNIRRYFSVIVTAEDTKARKPDPEPNPALLSEESDGPGGI